MLNRVLNTRFLVSGVKMLQMVNVTPTMPDENWDQDVSDSYPPGGAEEGLLPPSNVLKEVDR